MPRSFRCVAGLAAEAGARQDATPGCPLVTSFPPHLARGTATPTPASRSRTNQACPCIDALASNTSAPFDPSAASSIHGMTLHGSSASFVKHRGTSRRLRYLQLPQLHGDGEILAMDSLLRTIGELACAVSIEDVALAVRSRARALVKADGVTFVLREQDNCFYLDEDAIAPLWKGSRFPLETCISGWVILHGQIAVIPDIYADARIPHAAYRPTFVKSLAMVPVPQGQPVGAIGAYWSRVHEASWGEQYVLQALANAAGVALQNMRLYAELKQGREIRT